MGLSYKEDFDFIIKSAQLAEHLSKKCVTGYSK